MFLSLITADLFFDFFRYILSSRIEVVWDISLYNIIVNIPWRDERLDSCNLVICYFSINMSIDFNGLLLVLFA